MKIRVLSFILAILFILSLLSCAAPVKEPNTPATPESPSPETAVAPEEKYPVQVPCEAGIIMPMIVDAENEDLPLIKIVHDREELNAYRKTYDAQILDDFRYFFENHKEQSEHFVPMLLSYYESTLRAFDICAKEDFFEHNILLMIVISGGARDEFENAKGRLVLTDTGKEKLEIDLHYIQRDFGGEESVRSMLFVSVPNDSDIDYETDIIVTRK